VYWGSESGVTVRDNIDAWCLDCFENNFTVPTSTVTILRSDIVDYAGLAGVDPRKALTLMSVFREVAARVAEEKQGQLLKTVTDEVWLEFPKSADAVEAALDLQPRFHESALKLNLPTPGLCSGIHCGEVTPAYELCLD
jgi:class 3 adenylate cyclase